ncbi:hypothetical protein LINPERHAP2_LOCUS12920 [Linum perenne]
MVAGLRIKRFFWSWQLIFSKAFIWRRMLREVCWLVFLVLSPLMWPKAWTAGLLSRKSARRSKAWEL